MNYDKVDGIMNGVWFSFLCTTALWLGLGTWLLPTPRDTREALHIDAIEHGVGTYYLDEEHNKQFKWLTKEELCKEK